MTQELSIDDSAQNNVVVKSTRSNFLNYFKSSWQNFKNEIRQLLTFHPDEWRNAFRRNPEYPILRRGDLDGLVALFIDNMATLLTIILILQTVLDADIVFGKIAPGYVSMFFNLPSVMISIQFRVALSMLWGNFYYVYMARKLAYKEKRGDVCTMPYGINTPGACKSILRLRFNCFLFLD